jgi:hypothetical protein
LARSGVKLSASALAETIKKPTRVGFFFGQVGHRTV